ncbi:DUF742 domain-containing protein [Haloechinothrix halophila]|uniref:DUF742 domain-containing protein n=1 Tax=Haloechinothrix halophila TaxID=1069073 RepID=UPI0004136A9B|nr:DUF742 domain-containing protein [Haloechinothrix halophila]
MASRGEVWFDDAAGPLVRPYALTRGRTQDDRYGLDLVTLVVSVQPAVHERIVEPEYADVLWVCEHPLSVAEVAAKIDLPLCVVKVMLADLIERNYVIYRTGWQPVRNTPDMDTMQKVLDGIRKL